MMHLLFYTRLLIYLVVVSIPFFHPAVVVPYDIQGIGLWFVIVPVMCFLSFYFAPPFFKVKLWLAISGAFLLIASLIFGGFSTDALEMLSVGALAFLLTVFVFKTQGRGRLFAALEVVFAGSLYYAFLSFSRSSEEIAKASAGVIKLLFILAVVTFFVHTVVLFLASFPKVASGKGKRNILIFIGSLFPVVLLIAFLIPTDFIVREVRLNTLNDELTEKTTPLDDESNSPFDGNLQNKWKRDREGKLEGLSPDQWKNLRLMRRGKGGGKQFAVMVVASKRDPLYLGSEYYGDLDPVRGLLLSKDEDLNSLSTMRLIETWQNTTPESEKGRDLYDASIFSTLQDRFFAYRPLSITPTILNTDYTPFIYSYEGRSAVSDANEDELDRARGLNSVERNEFSRYLSAPSPGKDLDVFKGYIDAITTPGMSAYAKVMAIVRSFKTFHYELGFNERVDIAKLRNFLNETKTGDCTEFANTTVLLARTAGVPARVVTGFVAAQDLQLPKHKRGLLYLQDKIEPLKKYSLDELFLVTTAHRHAWAQVFISQYGWIDVETTEYAIPPKMGGDPNDWNLVIPLMEKEKAQAKETPFPWLTLIIIFCIAAGALFAGIYLFKFGRELILVQIAKANKLRGLKALHKLLLIRLIASGYEYKSTSVTIIEYSEKYPLLANFASGYTELRYRQKIGEEEKDLAWKRLRLEFVKIMEALHEKRAHFPNRLTYIFSLKGLRY